MQALLGLLLLFIAPSLWAGPFDPITNDESVTILGFIFGSVGDITLNTVYNESISNLIGMLNSIISIIAAIVLSYVSVFSVIHTAHEGEMLGHKKTKWHAFWIPLRSIVGCSVLVPSPTSGFSLIQVAILWLVLQGVGAADSLWTIVMNSLLNGVSAVTSTLNNGTLLDTGEQIAPNLLNAATCMQSVQTIAIDNPLGGNYLYSNGATIQSFTLQGIPTQQCTSLDGSGNSVPYVFVSNGVNSSVTVCGTEYFGLNSQNLPQPDASNLCGSVFISATVSLNEYPSSVQNLYVGSSATQSTQELETYLQQAAQLVYSTKVTTYSSMLNTLLPIAQGYVNGWYTTPTSTSTIAPLGYIESAGNVYAQNMGLLVVPQFGQFASISSSSIAQGAGTGALAGAAISGIPGAVVGATVGAALGATSSITDNSDTIKAAVAQGLNAGWVSAGSFYFILNRTIIGTLFASASEQYSADDFNIPSCSDPNGKCQNVLNPNTGVGPLGPAQADNAPYLNQLLNSVPVVEGTPSDQAKVALYLYDAALYTKLDQESYSSSTQINFSSDPSGASQDLFNDLTNVNTQVLNTMAAIFNGNSTNVDPLLAHANFGRAVMLICEGAWLKIMSKLVFTSKSNNKVKNLVSLAVATMKYCVMTLLIPFIGFLWAYGALLSQYCPLIPFIFFTFGVLGWIMQVTEAILAAPIIAVGLLTPGGEEFGKIEKALGILANIFFRPSLMIFGFLVAGKVYLAAVTLVDAGMGAVFQSLNVSTLFSSVVVLAVYATFIISITNVCFAIIYQLPDKILRWIGSHTEETNIGDIEMIQGAAQDAAGKVSAAMQETSKKAASKVGKQLAKAAENSMRGGNNGPGGTTP